MLSQSITQSREEIVLNDLRSHCPDFIAPNISWTVLPRGDDPPDAIGIAGHEKIGLELTEWLHGEQTRAAVGRERMRNDLARVLDWQNHSVPANFKNVIVWPIWGTRIKRTDEAALCREFHEAIQKVDDNWKMESKSWPVILGEPELQRYPVLRRYIARIQFAPGTGDLTQYGLSWIDFRQDGGAYDPDTAIGALVNALLQKVVDFSRPEQQERIAAKRVDKLVLLVHVGFNQYASNTPWKAPWRNLRDVALEAAKHCSAAAGPFDEIWLFHSLGESHNLFRLYPEFREFGAST